MTTNDTNDNSWAAPSGVPGGDNPWGANGAPGTPAPPLAKPQPTAAAAGSNPWKPGIIMLRPLSFGETLEGAFKALRHNPKAIILVPAGVFLVSQIIVTALAWGFYSHPLFTDPYYAPNGFEEFFEPSLWTGLVLAALLNWVVTLLVQAGVTISASRSALGQRISVADVVRMAMRRLPSVVMLSFLTALAWTVAIFLYVLAIIGPGGGDSALGVGVLGILGLGVLGVWIGVKLTIALPAIVLEQVSAFKGIARSWRLTKGRFWPIFGLLIVSGLIVWFVSVAISIPLSLFSSFSSLSDPASAAMWANVSQGLSTYLTSLISVPFLGALYVIIYTDQRMRQEGFDLDLQQTVQERQGL